MAAKEIRIASASAPSADVNESIHNSHEEKKVHIGWMVPISLRKDMQIWFTQNDVKFRHFIQAMMEDALDGKIDASDPKFQRGQLR